MYTEDRRDLPKLMFQISMNLNVEKYSERERGERVTTAISKPRNPRDVEISNNGINKSEWDRRLCAAR